MYVYVYIRFEFLDLLRGVAMVALLSGRVVGVLIVPGAAFHVVTPRSALILLFSVVAAAVIVGGLGSGLELLLLPCICKLPLGSFLHACLLRQTY